MKRMLIVACMFGAAAAFADGTPGALNDLMHFQRYSAQRVSSSDPDLEKNGDDRRIAPGATLVLGDLEGPGVIAHIWCTVGSSDIFYGRSLVLRIYWDGADKPSVEAPLGDFFAVGHGAAANFTSEPVSASSMGRARNCFWKMPFRKSAKVTVTNESLKNETESFYYYLDWRKYDSLPEDIAYFHARYRQETPAKPGDYTILETQGHGHYVGTVYSVHQMETGWFGEGDDHFYIDGEPAPRLRGTGTEDYFCDGWGFRTLSTPYYGIPLWEGYFAGDRVSAYRWHIQDPIPFEKSLKVSIEHKGSVHTDDGVQLASSAERADWISSVAYWYQFPPVGFAEPIAPIAERIAPYRLTASSALKRRASDEKAVKQEKYSVNFQPAKDNAWIEFDFSAADAGRYQISAVLWESLTGGIYQPLLDGKPIGKPLDLSEAEDDPAWVGLDVHDLKAGTHTLRFEGRGSSPAIRAQLPRTNAFGLSFLVLLRLEDMKGYHQTMNRLLQERQGKK